MSDRALRNQLIKLAHQHPEFRKDILPLVTACDAEGPMMGKFEEGKPADPTENMTPEAKKEWEQNTEKYKDQFKGASRVKQGGSAMLRQTIGIRVRTTRVSPGQAEGYLDVNGVMMMTTMGIEDIAPFKFEATVVDNRDTTYDVVTFEPLRAVSGSGADVLLSFYRQMFQLLLATESRQLLGQDAAL